MPPAWARVVPRAEKTTDGGGVMEERLDDHFSVSASIRAANFGDSVLGARREMV